LESVTTIRADGSHVVLHPADVSGRFTRGRRIAGGALIGLYAALPWIKVGGYPAVFLDVASRRFHLFGWTLAAQDLWLLFFLLSGAGFSLFVLTALLGRVWCGWACPQTVFLDHVYRRIERWIEGDAMARRQLDAARWTPAKVGRRGAKYAVFAVLSLLVTHMFLAYFVSLPGLWGMMRAAPTEHWGAFLFVFLFAAALYFNFVWFREQLCIVLCPYGRLQSALIDDDSMVIGYDATRGEPRGKDAGENCRAGSPDPASGLPSEALAKEGDCVACHRCVSVCPTGIDIRQGLQIECIGCAACIDACDDVMTRLRRPRGLIRYDSLRGLAGRTTRWVRPRTIAYAILLAVGGTVAAWALSTVRPAAFGVTRMLGAAYFFDAHTVRNQFLVRLVNKRGGLQRLVVSLQGMPAGVVQAGLEQPVELAGMAEEVRPLVVLVPRTVYTGSFHCLVTVRDELGTYRLSREIDFLGPDLQLLREDEAEAAAGGPAQERR
jgi:cytochrome c oxidase accessory protein FixG